MCLSLANEKVKSEIAQNDIVVYKYLYKRGDHYLTPFQYFTMKLGKLYKSRLSKCYDDVTIGLHSFVNLNECIEKAKTNLDEISTTAICEFIIPKGARYYTGKFGWVGHKSDSIASTRIIFNKELITL